MYRWRANPAHDRVIDDQRAELVLVAYPKTFRGRRCSSAHGPYCVRARGLHDTEIAQPLDTTAGILAPTSGPWRAAAPLRGAIPADRASVRLCLRPARPQRRPRVDRPT